MFFIQLHLHLRELKIVMFNPYVMDFLGQKYKNTKEMN